jgi:ABC-2 type transport system ATP-binding protein
MVTIDGLSFRYGKKPLLFNQLSLDLEPNSIYGLLGRNGAGKTTLLKLLSGLRYRLSGSISVGGYDPSARDPRMLQELMFLGEEFASPPVTVIRYEMLYGPLYPRFDSEQYRSYVIEFELDPDQKLSEMSYGQKKKALLAFGLASNTRLLLLDEPTNGLDIPSKGQFRRLLAGATTDDRVIVVSTHQVRDMENLIDPIVILDDGVVIFSETTEAVSARVAMSVSAEAPSDAIYTERSMGGFASIRSNDGRSDSHVDLELLFNGVTSDPARFQSIFTKEAAL